MNILNCFIHAHSHSPKEHHIIVINHSRRKPLASIVFSPALAPFPPSPYHGHASSLPPRGQPITYVIQTFRHTADSGPFFSCSRIHLRFFTRSLVMNPTCCCILPALSPCMYLFSLYVQVWRHRTLLCPPVLTRNKRYPLHSDIFAPPLFTYTVHCSCYLQRFGRRSFSSHSFVHGLDAFLDIFLLTFLASSSFSAPFSSLVVCYLSSFN